MIDKKGSRLEWSPDEHDRADGTPCLAPKKGFWTLLEELAPGEPGRKPSWSATAEDIAAGIKAAGADFPISSSIVEAVLGDPRSAPSDFPWRISRDGTGRFVFTP